IRSALKQPLATTNSHGLLANREIPPEKPIGIRRILLLGDSSPVGIGLERRQQAFGEALTTILNRRYADFFRVELINMAVSGFSSEQIRIQLKRGLAYDPDLVIVYIGNNDASVSGRVSDRELIEANSKRRVQPANNILSKSTLYRALKALLMPLKSLFHSIGDKRIILRVGVSRFRENLENIAKNCQRNKVPVVFVKPPVPTLWPAGLQFRALVNQSNSAGQIIMPDTLRKLFGSNASYCLDSGLMKDIYGDADIFTQAVYRSSYNSALARENFIATPDENSSSLKWNNYGVSLWKSGEYLAADSALLRAREIYVRRETGDMNDFVSRSVGSVYLYNIGLNRAFKNIIPREEISLRTKEFFEVSVYLDSALDADFFSLRIKRDYLKIFDGLLFEDRQQALSIVDVRNAFAENNAERLFIDHCHLTVLGHRIVANVLFQEIVTKKYLESDSIMMR
ncbi:MAG: hypothetical protein IIB00_06675, partial [candidate division Zixibacteria bacterium]|nr:hypothetical protein [candidate division Zixibacteria bacterium]